MDRKDLKRCMTFAAVGTAALYGFISGKGLFNKPRFREQHDALSKYVDNNYPDCTYSSITLHGRGWSSVIRRGGKPVCLVYFSKSPDGIYVFTESRENL